MSGRQTLSNRALRALREWGDFPRRLRRLYLAQSGRCPYCGNALPLLVRGGGRDRVTRDHVRPRARGGTWAADNVVLAHERCNSAKGDRAPTACERMFAIVTQQILVDFYEAAR